MTANEYQQEALVTWTRNPIPGFPYLYPLMGLVGEAGEIQNKVKKLFRDDGALLTAERRAALIEELGDAQWYLAVAAHELGTSLEEVMRHNIAKLRDRQERGVVQGDGDNR